MPNRTVRPSKHEAFLLWALTAWIAVALPPRTLAADAKSDEVNRAWLMAHYTKYEFQIPMRDGVKLFTAVYCPKDNAQPYPILLMRTPYGLRPYGADNYPEPSGQLKNYAKEKFIFASQDVRGRNGSEGEFVHMRPILPAKRGAKDVDESTDTYDTIDWLVKNIPNNNGKVGMMGISYPGFYTAAGMIDSHPALKAASPQAPIADWFIGDDFRHNGVFYLAHAFGFLSGFGQQLDEPTRQDPRPFDYETPNGYEFYLGLGPLATVEEKLFKGKITFWNELLEHDTYDGFWQARNLRPHLKNVRAAVMTVGGWFDAEDLFGPLKIYDMVERSNPGITNLLVIGPWAHGGWGGGEGDRLGNVHFRAKTAEFYRENIELPFFKHFLKDDAKFELPEAYVFETGTHQWRRYDSWPPKGVEERALFFHEGGKLAFEPPKAGAQPFDEYVSDPSKPVPFIPNIAVGMTREHMTDDQRFAASRPDVCVYQTDVLTEDVTIAGPITASLHVSTTGTDSDWVVKLIDVYHGDYPDPDPNPAGVRMGGYQQLVRGEAFRGKFRNSFEKPEPFEPGKVERVEYVLPDAYHTFRRGHRIMVHVQSSWFPLVDRNPQKFVDTYKCRAEDFQKATQRVYRSAQAPSQVRLKILANPAAP
ncbi:MAG: CocE/NonD family hydrolase [Verrucomicrobia bacterium]|nr:CocE/NonD family hydrolase [Verrucomicrobiota bacterium]